MKLPDNPKLLLRWGVALILLIGAICIIWRLLPDRQLARARKLQGQLADRSLDIDQRRLLRDQFRQEMQGLSAEQRRSLFGDRRRQMAGRIHQYFQLAKQDRLAYLDAQIDRMQKARPERQGNPPFGNGAVQRISWQSGNPQDREQRRKEWLDKTTPQDRAERQQFMKDLRDRMQQRGIGWAGPGRR
jgi:hypothetical protein